MKKLGLVGGMGPESTIPYYHDLVYGVQKRLGEKRFPELTIESVDVFTVLGLCRERKYDELTDYLLNAIENLKKGGADFGALSANTPHIVFDRLSERSPLPLVSIVETARDEAVRRGLKKIGLLGTVLNMEGDFFKSPFVRGGIAVAVPSKEEQEYIDRKITDELELGVVREETLLEFQKIIRRMEQEEEIQAVALGCTGLPLLLNDQVSPVPCLDTMKIHVEALIERIVEEEGMQ